MFGCSTKAQYNYMQRGRSTINVKLNVDILQPSLNHMGETSNSKNKLN